MTEKEKRDSGLPYNPNYDKELLQEMEVCKDKLYDYNLMRPNDNENRINFIENLFGSVGSIQAIQSPFLCDYGYNIHIGKAFYANHGMIILDGAKVTFGDNVFIGPNCGFHSAGHSLDRDERAKGLEYAYPITVGDDVWFGAGVQVLAGVTIGSNVVIGAGSVVNKDIPNDVVAAGNPCKVIRKICDSDRLL